MSSTMTQQNQHDKQEQHWHSPEVTNSLLTVSPSTVRFVMIIGPTNRQSAPGPCNFGDVHRYRPPPAGQRGVEQFHWS